MKRTLTLIATLLMAVPAAHAAELKLPSIFSDHMVLQSAKPVPVWGWAAAGEKVAVEFAGQSKNAVADGHGKWMVKLNALEASATSRELIVKSLTRSSSLKIADVIVGEVWAGGGHSSADETDRG